MEYSNKDLKPVSNELKTLASKIVKDKQNYKKWLYNAYKINKK